MTALGIEQSDQMWACLALFFAWVGAVLQLRAENPARTGKHAQRDIRDAPDVAVQNVNPIAN